LPNCYVLIEPLQIPLKTEAVSYEEGIKHFEDANNTLEEYEEYHTDEVFHNASNSFKKSLPFHLQDKIVA
jgi:hypothetical protein